MGPQTSYFSKANLPKIRPKPFRLLFISNLHPTPHGGGIEEPDEMCKTSWFKTNSSTKRCFTSPNMPGLGVESLTGQPGPSRSCPPLQKERNTPTHQEQESDHLATPEPGDNVCSW
ncbi:uncharacterized protein LOC103667688 isoform X3 [Ursus maritimus]|uniref:Uncharacterized protein LOC103667688 isoform X3 n=1 Tax=Ursus maritimus TaxID=29073 RepID=A0A8M1GK24_URSMA|nr:uncharacterized protein LOC103667688 isoform X3 [Ursus maritimus]